MNKSIIIFYSIVLFFESYAIISIYDILYHNAFVLINTFGYNILLTINNNDNAK